MALLIEQKDVAKAANLHTFKLDPLAGILMSLLSFNKVNQLYNNNKHLKDAAFVEAILNDLALRVEFKQEDIDKLPDIGPFITISNHPIGGLEGLLLIHLLSRKRKDMKIVANYMLRKIEPISEFFLPVDPFEGKKQKQNSVAGLKQAFKHLDLGGVISFFPAGEVSTFQREQNAITDRKWQQGVVKFIQKANVPVIPIYFDGNSGPLIQIFGMLHPNLRTASLASRLVEKSGDRVGVRIGKPIKPDFIQKFEDSEELSRYLRAKTYALDTALKVKPFYNFKFQLFNRDRKIADEIAREVLVEEVAGISHLKLFEQGDFEVYIADAEDIPQVLKEIGRLREITFRAVGEGAGHQRDLDEFDLYYKHLFLWDKKSEMIVGSYRLGKGFDILYKLGSNGFYTASLFTYKKAFSSILRKSIELGRSFVRPEYQRKVQPLFILWKGILCFLLQNKEYRYLLGPVSISNYYSKLSKSLMVEFIKKYHFDADLASMVKPKKRFKFKSKKIDTSDLLKCEKNDLRFMDQLINDIEPDGMAMPVLLKKYIKQNARIIGFNVDPNFGKALDGLMILDLNDIPAKTLEDLQRDFHLG